MLLNLRRSLIFAIIAVGLTFAYAYLGTGLSQIAFKSKADGSITASGSTLIGQNWSSPRWFHGRPDDAGPYAADPKETRFGRRQPARGQWRTRGVGRHQPRAAFERLARQHKRTCPVLAQAWCRPDTGPRNDVGKRV